MRNARRQWKLEISGLGSGLYLGHKEKDDSEAFGLEPLTLMEKNEGRTVDWEVTDKHQEFQ